MVGVKDLVLRLLSQHPEGVLQSSIHRAIGTSKSRVSEVLRELEAAGVISRVKLGNQYLVKALKPYEGRGVEGRVVKLGVVWSSEYPFIAPFAKELRDRFNYVLDVTVYPNALRATWALVRGEVDLVLSPLITQLYAFSLTKALRIVGGGAYGGAAVMEGSPRYPNVVASSELSAMDACRAAALGEEVPKGLKTVYFSRPEDAVRLAIEGRARYFVVWHPLTERLSLLGLKHVALCKDLEITYCCTLAASVRLNQFLRRRIALTYSKAIEEFVREPGRWVEWYSAKVGLPVDVVRRGLGMYSYRPYLDKALIGRMLSRVGLQLPDPNAALNAIEEFT